MDGLTGLLYSQIGYDAEEAKRIIVRSTDERFLTHSAVLALRRPDGSEAVRAPLAPWGGLWGSHWWVAELGDFAEAGTYSVHVLDGGQERLAGEGLTVGPRTLWAQTARLGAIDMLERRGRLAKAKVGWQDAGAMWQEANSHASMLVGLCDVLRLAGERLSDDDRRRVERQVISGGDYLARCQDKAAELGLGDGPISHDLLGHEQVILASDAAKAALAWAQAALALSDAHADKRSEYIDRSERAQRWLATDARPVGDRGFHAHAHGLPEGFVVPDDQFLTHDLLTMMWAACELARAGRPAWKDRAVELAGQILRRQVPRGSAEDGLFGHFYSFQAGPVTDKAWSHNLEGSFGADVGGTFPFYLVGLIEMLRDWPDHPHAPQWQQALKDFAYGFFLPACRRSPFGIIPMGTFGAEGLLWFSGLWHGMNAVYGLSAAQALELERHFSDGAFREIAIGNLQWIAGLNAGITASSLFAAHMFSMDVPDGVALPASMMVGVGRRWAGNWMNIRGSICNGFSTGDQFRFDVPPRRETDGPHAFTDEDWIPHTAGWLSGIVRL